MGDLCSTRGVAGEDVCLCGHLEYRGSDPCPLEDFMRFKALQQDRGVNYLRANRLASGVDVISLC